MGIRYIFNQSTRRQIMNSTLTTFKFQPPVNRDMRTLDRSFFVVKVPLCVVKFTDPKNISLFSKEFKDYILRVPRIPHVVKLSPLSEVSPQDGKTLACDNKIISKGVLLNDDIRTVEEACKKLPQEAMDFLKNSEAELLPYEKVLDYKFWKAEEILRAVLPLELLDEIPTGFTVTGHIAHLNLREEFKPYDSLIGQVILDKNNKIETVVDKVSSIATKFRTFPMKVIAGCDDSLVVEQRESDCVFRFDFSKVYWNSRLHTEHDRLVSKYFQPGQVVCDVFAGVGPFAIPAGKKHVFVLANDLNPESFKYLQENIKLNKVDSFVEPYDLDGAQFIQQSPQLLEKWANRVGKVSIQLNKRKRQKKGDLGAPSIKEFSIPLEIHHYVMNLPDSSITFLRYFKGLFNDSCIKNLPWIHIHCFEKHGTDEEPTMDELHERVHKRILRELSVDDSTLPLNQISIHLVRKVSPTKPMFCASFQLPKSVARN
ncbi:TRM5 (YHR070W) [Zygosaccharomyces parabailii]|nr:TRM5 (YHR070W) [Zygosaccharomyces parabailii]